MHVPDAGFYPPDQCRVDRVTLRDPALQAELEDRGYVVVPFLDDAQVDLLVEGYDRIAADVGGANAPGDYNDTYAEFSIIHSRPEFRRQAYALITETLMPVVDEVLLDHRPLIANFVNKPPGTGVVPAHQNFSVVDETRYRSVSVWVALVDCVVENGAMSMLDASHVPLRGRRGMWAYETFSGIEQDLIDEFITPVEVPRGHAVILDDAVVHYSPPNRSSERRLAIQFVVVPDEADAIWFEQVGLDDGVPEVDVWNVDERFFFEFWHGTGDGRFGTRIDHVTVPHARLDVDGLRRLLGHPVPEAPAPLPEPAEAPSTELLQARRPRAQRGLRARISRLSR